MWIDNSDWAQLNSISGLGWAHCYVKSTTSYWLSRMTSSRITKILQQPRSGILSWQSQRRKSKSGNKKAFFQPLLPSYLAIANWPKCQFPVILYHNILHIYCGHICVSMYYICIIDAIHTDTYTQLCIFYNSRSWLRKNNVM